MNIIVSINESDLKELEKLTHIDLGLISKITEAIGDAIIIPDDVNIKNNFLCVIPKESTNDDVIKALFPNAKVKELRYFDGVISHYEVNFGEENNKAITTYMPTWWDAPYKRGANE